MQVGASAAVTTLKKALSERADATMRDLVLKEGVATTDHKDRKRASRRQRNHPKLETCPVDVLAPTGVATQTIDECTVEQRQGGGVPESVPGKDCGAVRDKLHKLVVERASAAENAAAITPREALAERARRRSDV